MKKVSFYTLGCKVNQYETQSMMEIFKKAGYEVVDFEQPADVYIINTCTVTSFGDKKSRQIIRRAHRINPEALIAVVGCYAQVSHDEVEKIEGVDIVAGTGERSKILQMVESAEKNKKLNFVTDIMKKRQFEETGFISCSERTRVFIKIQEGCSNFCSYCIIPYARGPVRSRSKDRILKEVNSLVSNGFAEVVLTGINLSSYGKDEKNASLIEIIEEVNKIEGLERIRLGSVDPDLFTEEFISRIKNTEKLCPHFHISLQSGSDSVLKRMNRKYTTGEYKERVDMLRETLPDVSVTTDIMVGFPGETEEEFRETYRFLDEISLSRMHVFKYSRRKGTPAASLPGQIAAGTKEERSRLLLELSERKEREFNSTFIGKTMEVLFEQELKNKTNWLEGHTANFIKVEIVGKNDFIGKFMQVKLQETQGEAVLGTIEE